ncbi:MAG: CDP-diacylglycerol---serine O-phosphatidyltransferase [Acidobacteriota bacterium]|jgi:CDP-diacylglycerol--serine O-phosphatidyltransferase|nr:CDP-diacylglycerol---serine O-phosphatidyltransferase [Acidobacteriota bacterium]
MIQDVPHSRPQRPAVSQRLQRGAYLLPSLFTVGNMLLGFYAVICGLRGQFRLAAILVFVAAIVDTFDGLIARVTNTESDFGKEYDSLADVITFGAVPAILTWLWGLDELHRDAWLLSAFFMICTATRLARFNVQHKVVDKRWFVGLPTPAAAGTICSLLFYAPDREWKSWMIALVAVSLLLVGLLMVSTFRYRSVKGFDPRQRMSYRVAVPIAALLLVIYYQPYAFFLILAVAYTLSGPALWLFGQVRGRGRQQPPEGPPEIHVEPADRDDLPPLRR